MVAGDHGTIDIDPRQTAGADPRDADPVLSHRFYRYGIDGTYGCFPVRYTLEGKRIYPRYCLWRLSLRGARARHRYLHRCKVSARRKPDIDGRDVSPVIS